MTPAIASTTLAASLDELEPLLAPEELWRLRAMSGRERRRAEGRAHAYILLRSLLGLGAAEARIDYRVDGRPELGPLRATDVSISHREERVLVGAVPRPRRVGVDTEWLDDPVDAALLAKHALDERERELVTQLCREGLEPRAAILSLWAMKEAVCKAAGLELKPRSVLVTALDVGSGAVSVDAASGHLARLAEEGWVLETASVMSRGRYVDAVAVLAPHP